MVGTLLALCAGGIEPRLSERAETYPALSQYRDDICKVRGAAAQLGQIRNCQDPQRPVRPRSLCRELLQGGRGPPVGCREPPAGRLLDMDVLTHSRTLSAAARTCGPS